MSVILDLEYGDALPAFPVPEGFEGVYPTGWGCCKAETESTLDGTGLLYILSGTGEVQAGEARSPYQANQVIALGGSRVLMPGKETRYLYLLLDGADSLLGGIQQIQLEEDSIGLLMARMYQNALKGLPEEVYTASSQCYALLMELHRMRDREGSVYSELVRAAMKIMQEEYAFLAGVDELSQRLEVSKSHLVRRFSAETGRGPGRYLQEVRLESARQLLMSCDFDVELIAGMTGYSCANYFCKVFRRELGMSPGAYRTRYRRERPAASQKHRLQEIEEMMAL
jgi:AraC-like DNA-binding protein